MIVVAQMKARFGPCPRRETLVPYQAIYRRITQALLVATGIICLAFSLFSAIAPFTDWLHLDLSKWRSFKSSYEITDATHYFESLQPENGLKRFRLVLQHQQLPLRGDSVQVSHTLRTRGPGPFTFLVSTYGASQGLLPRGAFTVSIRINQEEVARFPLSRQLRLVEVKNVVGVHNQISLELALIAERDITDPEWLRDSWAHFELARLIGES